MLIKTLLNKVERFKSFVYGSIRVKLVGGVEALVIDIEPRRNSRPICPECGKQRSVYDRQPQRLFEYLPVWSFKAYFRYAPRRVKCPELGIKVEALPWGYGKERMTFSYQVFLARWAKRLSWKETADIFETSWDTVFRAVKFVVDYGLAHRSLEGVTEIGVDEIKVFKGHKAKRGQIYFPAFRGRPRPRNSIRLPTRASISSTNDDPPVSCPRWTAR